MELIGFAQRVMGPAAPKKTPSEAHAAQAHVAGFDAVDGRSPTPDAPEEEKKVCSLFLTDLKEEGNSQLVCIYNTFSEVFLTSVNSINNRQLLRIESCVFAERCLVYSSYINSVICHTDSVCTLRRY